MERKPACSSGANSDARRGERAGGTEYMEKDLTSGSVLKNIFTFSLPYLLSYFLQTLYGMADLFIIGRFEGVASTTAVSIGSQVMHMITVILVGVAMGTTVCIGRAVGAGDKKQAAKVIGNTVTLFMVGSVVLAAALVLVLTAAYAAVVTHTELVWNAGHPIENEADDRLGLLTGKAGTSGDSRTIGGVTFTVQDGIYSPETGQLFASAVISADESVQLVAVEADMEHEVRLTTPVDAKLDPSGISWAEWAEQNGKTLVPIGMEAAPTLQFLKVNGQTTDTPLIGAFLTQNPDGTVSAGFQVDLTEADTSHLKSCEVQLECRVGAFGKDGKATQWQKEILTATITFK